MANAGWYELRVAGSAGTKSGTGATEGIAIADNGRLCAIGTGRARKFPSESDAINYLNESTNSGAYKFEVVLCRDAVAAHRESSVPPG